MIINNDRKYQLLYCSGSIETSCVETNIGDQKGYRCVEQCIKGDEYGWFAITGLLIIAMIMMWIIGIIT